METRNAAQADDVTGKPVSFETSVRVIDLRKLNIPDNCKQIVLTHNKTRIVIRNANQAPTTSTLKRHELIMKRVREYFSAPQRFADVKPYLLQTAPTSMRLLDYFVTSYARRNRLMLETKRNGVIEKVDVFTDYKCFLKAYSKRSFDPFCRRVRTIVTFDGDPQKLAYVTTAASCNFLCWAHEIGLLQYCERNRDIIERDLAQNSVAAVKERRGA